MQKIKTIRPLEVPDILRRGLVSWLFSVTLGWFLLPGELHRLETLDGLKEMSFFAAIILTVGGAVLLSVLSLRKNTERAEKWGMVFLLLVLGVSVLIANFSWALLGAFVLIEAELVIYTIRGWNGEVFPIRARKTHGVWLWITAIMTVAFFLLVSAWTVGRVLSFCCPSYDFGIFSQMFYHMAKTGLPMTTLERDGLLSHFAVHVSPIYYLMLPFYMSVPTPATLQVLQAALMASAVIPLWLIGKHHGLTGMQRMLLCALLLLFPAFSGGSSYDLHENCFLTALILWLFYGIEKKNLPLTAAAALLTLTVKEDAAVYVAVVALWLMVQSLLRRDKRNLFTGLVLFACALGWFFAVTGYLAESGDGVMTYRYQNFMYDGSSSLLTIVKSVILCPQKAIFECTDPEKWEYIALTMIPLLGLPLFTRRYERLILLVPYLLVNLMSDYPYQHNVFFQYSFGSIACLFYLAAVNLADLKRNWRRLAYGISACIVSAVCFGAVIVPAAVSYPGYAVTYSAYYQHQREVLAQIPADASVAATTFYTTSLSQRDVLYDVRYASKEHLLSCDYVVLSKSADGDFTQYNTAGQQNGYENLVKLLEENRYLLVDETGSLVIYQKSASPLP